MKKFLVATFVFIFSVAVFADEASPALATPPAKPDPQTDLVNACDQKFSDSSRAAIEAALKAGADLNAIATITPPANEVIPGVVFDKTCLGTAAGNGDVELLNYLLQKGALVLKGDETERLPGTQLKETARAFDLISRSTENEPDKNLKLSKSKQLTNILVAALVPELKNAKLSIDTPVTIQNETALAVSVASRANESVDLLLTAGADANLADRDGGTAVLSAVINDDVSTVQTLLDHKATIVCTKFNCPITVAAWGDDVAMVKLLFKHGADANTTSPDGEPAIVLAARSAKPTTAFIYAFIEAGADPKVIYNNKGNDGKVRDNVSLLISTITGTDANPEVKQDIALYLLQDKGLNPNLGCQYSMTALGLAKNYKLDAIAALLIQFHADPLKLTCVAN